MNEKLNCLAERIQEADAVMIGIGSGLSSASGYNHYHWTPTMEKTDAPLQLKERGMYIQGDLQETLSDLEALMREGRNRDE